MKGMRSNYVVIDEKWLGERECLECQRLLDTYNVCRYVPDYCQDCCSQLVPECDHQGLTS